MITITYFMFYFIFILFSLSNPKNLGIILNNIAYSVLGCLKLLDIKKKWESNLLLIQKTDILKN